VRGAADKQSNTLHSCDAPPHCKPRETSGGHVFLSSPLLSVCFLIIFFLEKTNHFLFPSAAGWLVMVSATPRVREILRRRFPRRCARQASDVCAFGLFILALFDLAFCFLLCFHFFFTFFLFLL
jgi:hypothetical protein